MRGEIVIYFPEIRPISRDRVAVEGNRPKYTNVHHYCIDDTKNIMAWNRLQVELISRPV